MNRLALKLKSPSWERLRPEIKAPYLRLARDLIHADVGREGQAPVTPEEIDDAVEQAAKEMYAEACEHKAREKAASKPSISSRRTQRLSP